MWVFDNSTGKIYQNIKYVGTGYSGAPGYIDNPSDEELRGKGPIPVGLYTISTPQNNPKTGPYSLPLTPDPSNEMFGREDFLIHGDSVTAPGTASEGCIILARAIREQVWNSGDRELKVVSVYVVGTVQ